MEKGSWRLLRFYIGGSHSAHPGDAGSDHRLTAAEWIGVVAFTPLIEKRGANVKRGKGVRH
ncbi:hypothetical protein DESC_750010 [Desulfosarcina cetonica]|nr:hypothetical protein DESC_750010 [Desulfosarcina cetonica]